jgi:hypothetical protein
MHEEDGMKCFVEIFSLEDGEVVKRIPCQRDEAEQVKAGASINLNHAEYGVRVAGEMHCFRGRGHGQDEDPAQATETAEREGGVPPEA